MADTQARKEATLRRINGLKTSLARIVSSSSHSDREAVRPPLPQQYADPHALEIVPSPDRVPSHHGALRPLSSQVDPLTYLDYAQQEVERLTVERNHLMRTCASQEAQLQTLQAASGGAMVVRDADGGQQTMLDAAQALVSTIKQCYPAMLQTSDDSNETDPSLALTRLARVLPSIVAGSKLGDALSVAGADLLDRVGSLEDEVETDHYRLLTLVDQLTTANENLKRDAVVREAELHRLQAAVDKDDDAVDDTDNMAILLSEKQAADAQSARANSELAAVQAKLSDLTEDLAQHKALLSEQKTVLQRCQDDAAESKAVLTDQLTRKADEAAATQDTVQSLQAQLAAMQDTSQQIATLQGELTAAREACRTAEANTQTLQEEKDTLEKELAAQREAATSSLPQSLAGVRRVADDSAAIPSELTQDRSMADESSYVSVADESQGDMCATPHDGDDSHNNADRRTTRRRASEVVAAKRKTEQLRRQTEELEQRLLDAEIQIRTLTAALERERMPGAKKNASPADDGTGEVVAAAPAMARRYQNPLFINFSAVALAADMATANASTAGASPLLYPPAVDVSGWLDSLVVTKDFNAWAEQALNASEKESIDATGALYHVGLTMAAAAHLWDDTAAERMAAGRLMLQVQRFVDHPTRPDAEVSSPEDGDAPHHQNKTLEALRFCHVCLQHLPFCDGQSSGADAIEARMSFFLAAACQFVYTDGRHAMPERPSPTTALTANERWQRVESLIEHVHRHDATCPLFATEAMFERVTAAVRALLSFTTDAVALAMEVAFFPEDEDVPADLLDAHRVTVAQTVLLLSQNACLFRGDAGADGDGDASATRSSPLDDQAVRSLNSSLMGVTYSPTDAMVAHIDAVVLPLAVALARAAPSLKSDLLSVLVCRRWLPFAQNRQWHVPNAVLDSVVAAALEGPPREAVVPLESASFLKVNKELARLYRENAALRKTLLRVVVDTES